MCRLNCGPYGVRAATAGCLAVLSIFVTTAGAQAQQAQAAATGQVLDAATGQPVPGAIVVGIGADDFAVNTVLTDGDGRYTLRYPQGTLPTAVRVERIGYTAQVFRSPEYSVAEFSVLRVSSAPVQLEGITAAAESLCGIGIRGDADVYRVWEEVRKSLVTSDLTISDRVLTFDTENRVRSLDSRSGVVLDGSTETRRLRAETPYRAISVEQMTEDGWVDVEGNGAATYYAPNAELLLSEQFTEQHCFNVDRSEDQVVLAFEPNRARGEIPEIQGRMNLDATTLELSEIRFEYVGLPREFSSTFQAEGEVRFYGAPNGLRTVRDWAIRMPVVTMLRSFGSLDDRARIDYIREVGGRVLSLNTGNAEITLAEASSGPPANGGPIEDRLTSWSQDGGADGVLLYLRNDLPFPVVATGIELWDCINVNLSCSGIHPVDVRVDQGGMALLFSVPRTEPLDPIDFRWTYSVRNEDDSASVGQ